MMPEATLHRPIRHEPLGPPDLDTAAPAALQLGDVWRRFDDVERFEECPSP